MYSVRWVTHYREDTEDTGATEERSFLEDPEAVVSACIERLAVMRQDNPISPPDGFIVLNEEGEEVRRWFGSARPVSELRSAVRLIFERVHQRGHLVAVTSAIEELREAFPALEVSDTEIIEALTSEANHAGADVAFDAGEPKTSTPLEEWDNEGGAIKSKLTESERQEARSTEQLTPPSA